VGFLAGWGFVPASLRVLRQKIPAVNKSFLVLFFKKEPLSFFCSLPPLPFPTTHV
jgi:hypothetical protein